MAEEKVEISNIPAGFVPEPINNPWDCPTIVVDGVLGVAISPHQVRISLVEHLPGPEKLVSKYVAHVLMPVDQFEKFRAALNAISDQINTTIQAGQ
jgi:hypothetical protein